MTAFNRIPPSSQPKPDRDRLKDCLAAFGLNLFQ